MVSPKNIVVVCEGESEWTYLQRLNSALASEPFPEGWVEPPVRFIGRPKKTGVGKGSFKAVERVLRKEMKMNPSAEKWAWVDADLYARDYKDCGTNYQKRATGIPPFHFSIFIAPAMKYVDLPSLVGGAPRAPRNRFTPHFAVFRFRAARGAAPTNTPRINIFPRRIYNFEDFLALHLDDEKFGHWVTVMTDAGHFKNPLHWDDYKGHFENVVPGYQKGGLPADFVTLASLGNLKRHLSQMPVVNLKSLRVERTFAQSMLKEILRWYTIPE